MLQSLGAHTFGFVWRQDVGAAVEDLAAAGFTKFQLFAMSPHLDAWAPSVDSLERVGRTVRQCSGEILAVDLPSSDINLASPSKDATDFAVTTYLKVLDLAERVGARWLTLNSGRRHALLPPPDNRLLTVYRASLERLVRAAEGKGLRILIENIPGMLLSDAESLAHFLEEQDYGLVDVLYDVSNAWAIGENPVQGLRRLHSRVAVVHLSDAKCGTWKHDPIGAGDIDFAAIREVLISESYKGDIVLEVLSDDPLRDMVRSRTLLAQIDGRR